MLANFINVAPKAKIRLLSLIGDRYYVQNSKWNHVFVLVTHSRTWIMIITDFLKGLSLQRSALSLQEIYLFPKIAFTSEQSRPLQLPTYSRSQKLHTKYGCRSFITEERINYQLPNYKVWLMGCTAMGST